MVVPTNISNMLQHNILAELNTAQQQAVTYLGGPQLVIAGAGSGKTRVLTYKIAYLLSQGVLPYHILALTFTNKAAREMKDRIGTIVGQDQARKLYMGTFHSIFSHILRVEAQTLGYKSNFTIYDDSDSNSLIRSIIRELELDDKQYKPSAVHHSISMAKNRLQLPDIYSQDSDIILRDKINRMPETAKIYSIYNQRLKNANAMDFDDLLVNTYLLFDKHNDIRKKYAGFFQYVLVDEYQDTNYVQQRIVYQLTAEQQNICVVGDDFQSIYAFRGANIDNMLNFKQLYPSYKLFKLEQNYRSTQYIVDAANSLMKHNQRQIPKNVFSENEVGDKIQLKQFYSDQEEAVAVCKEIRSKVLHDDANYSDFAILYRTNSQSRSFEDELRKQGIPYRIYGGLSFYQRKEIKDVIAYFKMVANVQDEEAFKRIINYPARGIGQVTIKKIEAAALANNVSLWQICSNPDLYPDVNLTGGAKTKLAKFAQLINSFILSHSTTDAYDMACTIIRDSGINQDLSSSNDAEQRAKLENVEELLSGIQTFVETAREEGNQHILLSDYLQEVSLMTDADMSTDDDNRVSLLTIHSAKGLEFDNVFIVGLEENIFPSPRCVDSPKELEEERRLLYVAITRARKECFLTCAKHRWRYGHMEFDTPSRFIRDIDQKYVSSSSSDDEEYIPKLSPRINHIPEIKPRLLKPVSRTTSTSVSSPSAIPQVAVGQTIIHQRFGKGVIESVTGTGEETKATVLFENTGRKQLLLKFAKFNIVQ